MAESASLVEFAFARFLEAEGWPRQKGTLRKTVVVDAKAVDIAHSGLARIGMGLGCARPQLAVQLFGDMFGGPQSSDEWAALLNELDPVSFLRLDPERWRRPWSFLAPPFAEAFVRNPLIPASQLEVEDAKLYRYKALSLGLVFGLLYLEEVRTAFREEHNSLENARKEFGNPIPDVDLPSPQEWFDMCERLVGHFERERRPLRALKEGLCSEPRIRQRLDESDRSLSE
jgi:hypothetical protein